MSRGELNYQPSHSAIYYTPPTRLRPAQALIGFIAAIIGAIVGGIAYAKIQPHLENMILRAIAVGVAAGVTGLLATVAASYGKLRSAVFASFEGAAIAAMTLYAMWAVWVHDALFRFGYAISYWPLIRHPDLLVRMIRSLNETGTWSYDRVVERGFALAVFWAIEAGLILLCGVLFPIKAVVSSDEIECRECFTACRLVRPILRFAIWVQDELVAAVQNHEFARLLTYPAPQTDREPQLSLRLISCPKCRQTNVIIINRITWELISTGTKMEVRPVLSRLMVPAKEAEALKALMPGIMSKQEAPPETEEAPPETEDEEAANEDEDSESETSMPDTSEA